ncbi:flagellar basal body P-ring formation chaperone FlgA [Methylocystis sp. Sn-Cys]|uniref:flagellar basal body P-ring formation chaperone FlgA n=1 Tax=Methylocystis sp. Sn-Cys TaxID=1701263 RepID=UPI0019239885|nr:flagellar basal body P-ring formation chaperone FlgA [Methylocystis sp. Sn-Cys]MBL1258665.1 flagellar basal body P-ring formation protein FlgA [Methylocystis sp. Sn-Cys]
MATRPRGFMLAVAVAAAAGQFCAASSLASERSIPTPRVTIYPGDRLDDSVLDDMEAPLDAGARRGVVESRKDLVGKIARRTLLPGQPILTIAVDNPRLITIGTLVKIVFSEDGLTITALGMAMQAGAAGDLIRVRNQDSNLVVVGVVQPDGTVKVNEG